MVVPAIRAALTASSRGLVFCAPSRIGEFPEPSFVGGVWVFGAYDAWTVGQVSGRSVTTFLVQPTGATTPEGDPEIKRWDINGLLAGTGSTTMTVRVDNVDVGTLTVTKIQ